MRDSTSMIKNSMRKTLFIILSFSVALNLTACHTNTSQNTSDFVSLENEPSENSESEIDIETPNQMYLQTECDDWLPITGVPLSEEAFLETLDTDLLADITEQLQTLVEEMGTQEQTSPQTTLQSNWIMDYRNSEQYQYVLSLDIKAIKPLYYIISKSTEAGLYEYIICSAINDIVKYNFTNSDDYRWADAFEFRQLYNAKIQDTIDQFYEIVNDNSLDLQTKEESLVNLGVFCIPLLLNELDSSSSSLNIQSNISCIKTIIRIHTGETIDDFDSWKTEFAEDYRNIIDIL